MALIYADVCKLCRTHKTQHPSGICSRCRKLKGATYCKICGRVTTTHESGICHKCRRSSPEATCDERLRATIEDVRLTLTILEQRLKGESFSNIASETGLSKTAVYSRYMKAHNRNSGWGGIDRVDGSFIPGERE